MPHLVLTIGDPTGIGPEITVKALQKLDAFAGLRLTVIGCQKALMQAAQQLGMSLPADGVAYTDIHADKPGAVSYQAIEQAVDMIAAGKADGLVTGPISKKNLAEAGHAFPGHTEILEDMARRKFNAPDARAEMLFVHKNFRLLLLTRHTALKNVPAELAKTGAVAKPLKTLIRFLRDRAKIDEPRIAILGVNPHAGEVGGEEEKKFIMPVIHAVNGIGATQLDGPFAADAFFRDFDPATTPYHAVVAPYHDQGLIPFKMLAGYAAVNVTIGLPFIRTSVGHGTAEDIVGKGVVREDSLLAAIQTALDLVK
ncbi:MAG: 4-hydroxythreonine-4-phosphate dehydrogenase PdxA [Alphaproteobacteria bacterium]|nr:4-hydroxythreonine-4-phosphate dehydrogenase PdxA [Alphaproteobacteria bacterium]